MQQSSSKSNLCVSICCFAIWLKQSSRKRTLVVNTSEFDYGSLASTADIVLKPDTGCMCTAKRWSYNSVVDPVLSMIHAHTSIYGCIVSFIRVTTFCKVYQHVNFILFRIYERASLFMQNRKINFDLYQTFFCDLKSTMLR